MNDEPGKTAGDSGPGTGETKLTSGTEGGVDPHTLPPHERIDGLRAWLAQVDRKLGVRSYAGLAAIVLALAASIVAIVLAMSVRDDSATEADMRDLRQQVEAVEETATQAAEEEIGGLSQRLGQLENRIGGLESSDEQQEREIEALQDDISDVRDAIAEIESLPDSPDDDN